MELNPGFNSISSNSSNSVDIEKEVAKTPQNQNHSPLLTDEMSPEIAFVHYQKRSEDQYCQVCGQPSVGFHHRAYVCEACKKFFTRHMTMRLRKNKEGAENPETFAGRELRTFCPMGGRCKIEGAGRGKCPHCRFRKCLDLGMSLTPPGGEMGCDISQIPCRVCGSPSSGFHFGAITCEGCKGFFRRTALSNVKLECLGKHNCCITPANRNMCKSCRFQRCLTVGMSQKGSRIGRQPNAIKYYCVREISQLAGKSEPVNNNMDQASRSRSSTSAIVPAAVKKVDEAVRFSGVTNRISPTTHHTDVAKHLASTKATVTAGSGHGGTSKQHRPLADMHLSGCHSDAKRVKKSICDPAATSSSGSAPCGGEVTWENVNPLLMPGVINRMGIERARGTVGWPRKFMQNGLGGDAGDSRPSQQVSGDSVDGQIHQLALSQLPSHNHQRPPQKQQQQQHRPYLTQLEAYQMENGKTLSSDRSADACFSACDVSSSTVTTTTSNDQSVDILRSLIKQIIHESAGATTGQVLGTAAIDSTATHRTSHFSTRTTLSRHLNDTPLTNHRLASPAQTFCPPPRGHFPADACFLDGISSTSGDANCSGIVFQHEPTFSRCKPVTMHEFYRNSSSQTAHLGLPHSSASGDSPLSNRMDHLPHSCTSSVSTNVVGQQTLVSAGMPLIVSDFNTSTVAAAMISAQAGFSDINGGPVGFSHPPSTATGGLGVFPDSPASWTSFTSQEAAQSPLARTGLCGFWLNHSSGVTSVSNRLHGFCSADLTTNTGAVVQTPPVEVREPTGHYQSFKIQEKKTNDYSRGHLPSSLIPLQPNITVPLGEFTKGISIAAKYLRSERDRMNRHQYDLDPRFSEADSTEVVWENMMKAFEMHSKMVVNFTKIIPGINRLELNDKRQLVRSAMYPLMLVTLSRDFENGRYPRYNYFNFSDKERDVILQNFPAFKRVVNHLIQSGEMLHHLMLDDIEFTLICTQELLRSQNVLSDPDSCQHLLLLSMQVLINHEQSIAKSEIASERLTAIAQLLPMLNHFNIEHHEVLAEVRSAYPNLAFPALFTEMFALDEPITPTYFRHNDDGEEITGLADDCEKLPFQ